MRLTDPAVVAIVNAAYEDTKAAVDLAQQQLDRAVAANTLASRLQDFVQTQAEAEQRLRRVS